MRIKAVPGKFLPGFRPGVFIGWRECGPDETPDAVLGGNGQGMTPGVAREHRLKIVEEGVEVEAGPMLRRAIADGDVVAVAG